MRKLLFFVLLILGLQKVAEAKHLKGGWIQYEYLGSDSVNNTTTYHITVRQYIHCNPIPGQVDGSVPLGIFDAGTNQMVTLIQIIHSGEVNLDKTTFNPCISKPYPSVCYLIEVYDTVVTLPNNQAGYILSSQRCCRIDGIVNVTNSGNVGITYNNTIPGVINGVSYRKNSSPVFGQKDTVLVCYSSFFTFDFGAKDVDGDSLVYTFCDGLLGGDASNAGTQPNPPSNPPYSSIPYTSPYSGGMPLGANVTIDPATGLISGIAPATPGDYVVSVCVLEYRNGVLIGTTKKEIHIAVDPCSLSAAVLKPVYANCDNFTFNFFNQSNSPSITSYTWSFGDSLSEQILDTSHNPTPTHVYQDTGKYILTLLVTSSGGCEDSAKAIVSVYPGFYAKILVNGSCIKNPYYFIDSSYTKYGTINSWSWNAGEVGVSNDVFTVKDTSYIYPTPGTKTVKLTVGNSEGCFADTSITINVLATPQLNKLRDTLICNVDTLQLFASEINPSGFATFSWSPKDSVSDSTIADPFVYPKETTKYYVLLSDQGCFAIDSITVNTLASITVKAEPKDSNICLTDGIYLFANTQGLIFNWTSSNPNETVPSIKSPFVSPSINPTTYHIKANLGNKCFAEDNTTIYVYPYPTEKVSPRDSVCYGNSIGISGSVSNNANYFWYPGNSLNDSTSLSPIASPDSTTNYILKAYYTGSNVCPKPVWDTVKIAVIPKVMISAGDDTIVVVHEPLHLFATGNVDSATASFLWTTTNTTQTYLNNDAIYNPIATIGTGIDSVTYVVTATLNNPKKCFAMDTLRVLVYQTLPEIFVPTVFTPESLDGTYNREKPIPVGILKFDFFSVYNRLGQLLYTTSKLNEGWDGNYKGEPQPAGGYVYVVKASDYHGKPMYAKGTFVLIR